MAEEEESEVNNNVHTPSSFSPRRPPSPNPRKRKTHKDLLPSLSNCHSCDRNFPHRSQTLTELHPIDSEWRIVLLCDDCLRLVKSAAKCSYCFSDLAGGDRRLLDCLQCLRRVHFDCVPTEHRLILPSILNPESFVCVDCCALPRFGNRNPRSLFTRVSVEELVRDAKKKATAAARAKEKAFEKVRAAKCATERAKEALGVVTVVEIDPVVKDEELALQLHLAMNGSQRISRSVRSTNSSNSDRSFEAKKVKRLNGCSQKVEFCREDEGFLDSWNSSVELGLFGMKEPKKKEPDGCSSSEMVVKEEQGSCSDKVVNSSEENSTLAVWITYQRVRKSKGVGSREKSSEKKQSLTRIGDGENFSESEQTSRCNPADRYAKKYSKRKSILKKVLDGESVVAHWQTSCSKESTFSNAPLSSLPGCQS